MFQPAGEELSPFLQVITLLCGYMATQAVHTAAEFRLADLVQDGPKSTADLASATGADEGNLSRLFREDDPDTGALFNRAMTGLAGLADERIAEAYDCSAMRTLVDVGGGQGGFLMTVLKRNPALRRRRRFDLPEVIEQASKWVAASALADRIELVAGDLFQEVPKGGDASFMRQILLDWEESQCQIILNTCIQAMNPGGMVLIAESIPGPGSANLLDKLTDLVLMVDLPGRERDEAEFFPLRR